MKVFKLGDMVSIDDETRVEVNFEHLTVIGRIVGKATSDFNQMHIIECLDGTFPNKEYPYKMFIAPLYTIKIDE
jgi:hypothetical protein